MPKNSRSAPYYQTASTPQEIKEAAAAYGIHSEVVNVRQLRENLASLLDRAAKGEEIVVTSDGHPKARLVQYRPRIAGAKWTSHQALRDTMPMGPDSANLLDAVRADQTEGT